MTNYKEFILVTALFTVSIFQKTYGQNLKDIKLDNKQSILNGKAFFTFPTDAVNSPRPVDIMEADHNVNLETRIVLDIKKMKLVFLQKNFF